jgi:hypothetical protein
MPSGLTLFRFKPELLSNDFTNPVGRDFALVIFAVLFRAYPLAVRFQGIEARLAVKHTRKYGGSWLRGF